jgi:hypothetical protein
LDLQYCNGQKEYDFSTDGGFYYPGCDPKYYNINDLGSKAFRRAYVAALFAENRHWLTLIEGYHMLVPGTRKNKKDAARDLAEKEHLQEQVSPDTLEDRKAFFEAWKDASCCADNCEQYCDECSNKNIQFKSVLTFRLDADVRRYITKYWRYQTASELKEDSNGKDRQLSNREVCNGVIQCEQKPTRKPAKKQKTAACQTDDYKTDLLRRRPRKMVNG